MVSTKGQLNAFLDYPEVPVSNAQSGPLAGLTLAVKDIFDVAGYPTGCGNPDKAAESGPATTRSAPAVEALLKAGARFIGKTQTEELAFSMIGQNVHFAHPINPSAPGRVTGGSSSGSAAAVAGGLADIATGSDTGGSIRAPASFCGLIGLRTSHGAISLAGTMPLAPSFDTFGWFARDMATYHKVAEVLLGTVPSPLRGGWTDEVRPGGVVGSSAPTSDIASQPSEPAPPGRFATTLPSRGREPLSRPLSIAVLDGLVTQHCAAEYARLRGRVFDVIGTAETIPAPPQPLDTLYWALRKLQAREAWEAHGDWISAADHRLGKAVFDRFAFGRTVSDAEVETETRCRTEFTDWLGQLLGEDGFLIMPTVTDIAPRVDATPEAFSIFREASIRLLCLSGLSGFPQLSLPLGAVDGAPFGISLLGPKGSDLALLDLGTHILGSSGGGH